VTNSWTQTFIPLVRLFIHGAAFDDALDQIRGETNMSSSELYFCAIAAQAHAEQQERAKMGTKG